MPLLIVSIERHAQAPPFQPLFGYNVSPIVPLVTTIKYELDTNVECSPRKDFCGLT